MSQQFKSISNSDFFCSISLVILSSFCLAVTAGFGKNLTTIGSLQLVVFIRFFFPFLIILAWCLLKAGFKFNTENITAHIVRAGCVIGAQFAFFYVLTHGSVLLANLLYVTSGLFLPILTFVILRIAIPKQTIVSIIISFVGVVVALGVVNNVAVILAPITIVGLLSGLLGAGSQITLHYISKSERKSSATLMLFGLCSMVTFPLIFTHTNWYLGLSKLTHPSASFEIIILLFSVFSILNQTLKAAAYKYVNKASSLAPFFYAVIIFAGIIDWIFHGITPHLHTYIGVGLVIIGGVVMSIRTA